jgi:hypothetical protein
MGCSPRFAVFRFSEHGYAVKGSGPPNNERKRELRRVGLKYQAAMARVGESAPHNSASKRGGVVARSGSVSVA